MYRTSPSSRTLRTILGSGLLVAAIHSTPVTRAQSDFGDAPDGVTASYPGFPGVVGEFPTVVGTTNTRFPGNLAIEHDVTALVWLGPLSSPPTVEMIPNVTDLDVDNSGAFWWISLTGIPAGAVLDIPVTIAADAPAGPYYLNVLVDQNNDGEWKDLPSIREWAVRDRPISQAPGTTVQHGIPMWWSSGIYLLPKWVRISVTAEPLMTAAMWGPDGWDGSMPPGLPLVFSVGETEDRFVGATYPGTAGPGGGPPPGPSGGGFPGGAGGGARGKGALGPLPPGPGACMIDIECGPKSLTIPCGQTGFVTCRIKYLSGNCPKIAPGCNAVVTPDFVAHLRGSGPKAVVAPPTQCVDVGPGNRDATLVFSVMFPPPCDQQLGRKQRWRFDLQHDPDGVYSVVGPDTLEGVILSSVASTCGNGIPQPPVEACDDGNLLPGDTCAPDCQFPTYIPNGILSPGEDCDDGNTTAGDGCSPFGIREYCGNGVVDPHEACDDGNTIDGDGCNRFCQPEEPSLCGNGAVDHVLEQCDDGGNVDGDGCDAHCQNELCGDSSIDAGEQCDDGNTLDGDGCSALCQSEGECGNGWLDGGEACDDGNDFDDDGCSATCQIAPVRVGTLRIGADRETLGWESVVPILRRYQVSRGDLTTLRSTDGDIGQGSTCLISAHASETLGDATQPAPGEGLFYLVRTDSNWLAQATWEPRPPADGALGLRDTYPTACD